jgi:hypothetical protein
MFASHVRATGILLATGFAVIALAATASRPEGPGVANLPPSALPPSPLPPSAISPSAIPHSSPPTTSPYTAWKNGPSPAPDFFPLAVWLQEPRNAPRFKALGINTYVGLWKGPTEAQIEELKKQGMKLVCDLNAVARKHLDDPTIIAWMHGDEPDNAQAIAHWKSIDDIRAAWPEAPQKTLAQWGAYGPPIPPKDIAAGYEAIRAADPSRPVLLNLGQGVAYDKYVGRGYRSGKLEDYPEYLRGSDIVSFDIYPVVHDRPEIAGNLWYVARGVERLAEWSGGKKIIWNCIECTHISNPPAIAAPAQIRAEVWMSLIHGSRGIIYFVHEFKPKFIEAGLLAHPEQARAVAEVNQQVRRLAAVINSPAADPAATFKSSSAEVPLAAMVRRVDGATYIFAVAMRDRETRGAFTIPALAGAANAQAEVLDEGRSIPVTAGQFEDQFKGYEVHLYRVK